MFREIGSEEVYFLKIVGNDVIGKKWWRHNEVKYFGIVSNFFLWPCIVKMNNRANFYENRFGRSVFSEKRRIWRHTPKIDDVITPSKMSVSIWIFAVNFYCRIKGLGQFLAILNESNPIFQQHGISSNFHPTAVTKTAVSDVMLARRTQFLF